MFSNSWRAPSGLSRSACMRYDVSAHCCWSAARVDDHRRAPPDAMLTAWSSRLEATRPIGWIAVEGTPARMKACEKAGTSA